PPDPLRGAGGGAVGNRCGTLVRPPEGPASSASRTPCRRKGAHMPTAEPQPVLYVIACGAFPARQLAPFASAAQTNGLGAGGLADLPFGRCAGDVLGARAALFRHEPTIGNQL